MKKADAVQRLGLVRKGLSRIEAAAFINVSTTILDRMVRDGVMPRPKVYGALKLYDCDALRLAFEALPEDGEDMSDEWDEALT